MTQNINYLDLKKLDKLKIAIRTSFLVFHNIRSDCHYSDVINILLNAFRLKKKLQARNMELFNAIRRLYMILDFILTTLFGYSLVDGWMAEKKLCIEKNHGHLILWRLYCPRRKFGGGQKGGLPRWPLHKTKNLSNFPSEIVQIRGKYDKSKTFYWCLNV